MGNPHAILRVDSVSEAEVERLVFEDAADLSGRVGGEEERVPPHAHDTDLIQFCFRTCNYTKRRDEIGNWVIQGEDREEWPGDGSYTFANPIDIGTAVLVHGCNDGSLAKLVYKEITGGDMILPKKHVAKQKDKS